MSLVECPQREEFVRLAMADGAFSASGASGFVFHHARAMPQSMNDVTFGLAIS
ncbi:hypothetical protein Pla52o_54690 [Novipirellula galeiformis]|uniref:Uncharacterized protein n=1 Tax=Novipirellula galeiformis TaxID=2528004 RepID=A0A5C6C0G5_9BACT|nr:hypothetical protein [Novipirellula galeiformis]TWU17131.1 hypothetical protein Pla52o_54690 [Novipirellula galeiformis]